MDPPVFSHLFVNSSVYISMLMTPHQRPLSHDLFISGCLSTGVPLSRSISTEHCNFAGLWKGQGREGVVVVVMET